MCRATSFPGRFGCINKSCCGVGGRIVVVSGTGGIMENAALRLLLSLFRARNIAHFYLGVDERKGDR